MYIHLKNAVSSMLMTVFIMSFNAVQALVRLWAYMVSVARHETIFYYVDVHGNQLPFVEGNKRADVLVEYNAPRRYLFLTDVIVTPYFKEAYRSYEEPLCPFIGMQVRTDGKEYALDCRKFMVKRSTLFTPVFNKWLCKNVLRIKVTELRATIITSEVKVLEVTQPIIL
jgi:hypothetical protein